MVILFPQAAQTERAWSLKFMSSVAGRLGRYDGGTDAGRLTSLGTPRHSLLSIFRCSTSNRFSFRLFFFVLLPCASSCASIPRRLGPNHVCAFSSLIRIIGISFVCHWISEFSVFKLEVQAFQLVTHRDRGLKRKVPVSMHT